MLFFHLENISHLILCYFFLHSSHSSTCVMSFFSMYVLHKIFLFVDFRSFCHRRPVCMKWRRQRPEWETRSMWVRFYGASKTYKKKLISKGNQRKILFFFQILVHHPNPKNLTKWRNNQKLFRAVSLHIFIVLFIIDPISSSLAVSLLQPFSLLVSQLFCHHFIACFYKLSIVFMFRNVCCSYPWMNIDFFFVLSA